MRSCLRSIALCLALVAGAGSGSGLVRAQTAGPPALPADAVANFTNAWAQQPRVNLGIAAGTAKVVIVKFNDYQCPGCAVTHEWYTPILARFEKTNPGAVKYVVKDWPWNVKCNSALVGVVGAPDHLAACDAAAAVRMAGAQGRAKALEMQDWLYANLQTLSPESVQTAAGRILGVKNFAAEYAKHLPGIRQDTADGQALGVRSTPTLFINGVRIEPTPTVSLMPAQYFELAIQIELRKAQGRR
jgi:protein-disulfide isomerase